MIGERAVRGKDFPSLKGGMLRKKGVVHGKGRAGTKTRGQMEERHEEEGIPEGCDSRV